MDNEKSDTKMITLYDLYLYSKKDKSDEKYHQVSSYNIEGPRLGNELWSMAQIGKLQGKTHMMILVNLSVDVKVYNLKLTSLFGKYKKRDFYFRLADVLAKKHG